MKIDQLREIIEFIRKTIHRDFAMPQLSILLLVAENEGISQPDISKRLDMPQASVSRNVTKLCKKLVTQRTGTVNRGYELCEISPDPAEPRRLNVFLTNKGKKFIEELRTMLNQE